MKKLLYKIHLYLAIPAGIIISVICLTGAVLVLYNDIHELFNGKLYEVEEVKAEVLPMNTLVDSLLLQFPAGEKVTGVQIFADKASSYQFSLEEAGGRFFVNQYTGEFLGNHNPFKEGGLYRIMFYTHRWLMNNNRDMPIGKTLVGTATIVFVFIIITGFFIWLPRGLYSLKKGLSINLRRGWKRFWYDLHVVGGMYAAVGLLLLALTGLMWSFSWYRPMVFSLFGVEVVERGRRQNREVGEEDPVKYALWNTVLGEIQRKENNIVSIRVRDGEANVYNRAYGNVRAYDKYKFNKESGAIEKVDLYSSRPESSRFMGWVYALHVGTWGGMTTKILTFIISLLGGILPITGYYLWLKRTSRKKSATKRKKLALMNASLPVSNNCSDPMQ